MAKLNVVFACLGKFLPENVMKSNAVKNQKTEWRGGWGGGRNMSGTDSIYMSSHTAQILLILTEHTGAQCL